MSIILEGVQYDGKAILAYASHKYNKGEKLISNFQEYAKCICENMVKEGAKAVLFFVKSSVYSPFGVEGDDAKIDEYISNDNIRSKMYRGPLSGLTEKVYQQSLEFNRVYITLQ